MFQWVSAAIVAMCLGGIALAAPHHHPHFGSDQHLEQIASNHLAIWAGNYDLINQTWDPDVHLYQDRNPEPHGSIDLGITNSTAYLTYIEHARSGFSTYNTKSIYVIPGKDRVAVRWQIDSLVGPNIKQIAPQTTSSQGDPVIYNGTDILLIDQHTGLAYEVDSAFNTIDYEYQLGYQTLNVGTNVTTPD